VGTLAFALAGRHSGRLQVVGRPRPPGRPAPPVRRVGGLPRLHVGQRLSEPFVLDHRAGCHPRDLVGHAERQRLAAMPHREPAIGIVHHLDLLARQAARAWRGVQEQHHAVVVQGEAGRDRARLAPGQRLVRVIPRRQRPVQILGVQRRPPEALFVALDEPGQPGVGRLGRAGAGQAQLLHQPV